MFEQHCCFNTTDELFYSYRIHVPLARKCSLGCIYCNYSKDGNITNNPSRPGTSLRCVSTESQIQEYLQAALAKFPDTKIIGVSGPGDPMENISALNRLIRIIGDFSSGIKLCICTTGRINWELGKEIFEQDLLQYVTFTINTFYPDKMLQIYTGLKSVQGAYEMVQNQKENIIKIKALGKKVKINTVFLDDINNDEIVEMYRELLMYGVDCFNVLPRVSTNHRDGRTIGDQEHYEQLIELLKSNGIPLVKQCRRCRADFCGN